METEKNEIHTRIRRIYSEVQDLISAGKVTIEAPLSHEVFQLLQLFEPVRELMTEEEKSLYRKKVTTELEEKKRIGIE